MKRTFAMMVAGSIAVVLFVVLVHAVLAAAGLSGSFTNKVQGLTLRRFWATSAVGLALIGTVMGGMANYRAARRIGNHGRRGATVAVGSGLIATVNGVLNLALATGGPGTGNGVVGGAVAVVLGLVASVLGGLAMARGRRAVLQSGE